MPREGYKSITVKKELHQKLEALATKMGRSMGEYIELLLDNSNQEVNCH